MIEGSTPAEAYDLIVQRGLIPNSSAFSFDITTTAAPASLIPEAFAAQSLAVRKDLNLDPEKTNVNGGAIAIGHPIGASGCRILITLIYEMMKRDSKYGLATLCIGGGMGTALIVER